MVARRLAFLRDAGFVATALLVGGIGLLLLLAAIGVRCEPGPCTSSWYLPTVLGMLVVGLLGVVGAAWSALDGRD